MQARRVVGMAMLLAVAAPSFGAVSAGMVAGDPTGLSIKSWQGRHALDFGVGWYSSRYYYYYDARPYYGRGTELYVTADYVTHNYNVFHVNQAKLPVYYGAGVALWTSFGGAGIRVPVGVDLILARVPIDIFAEIAPTMVLAVGTYFHIGTAVGVRYRFD
ncbi:MAG: hypothetical protein AABY83_13235 [Pseudomonadota bacterium]